MILKRTSFLFLGRVSFLALFFLLIIQKSRIDEMEKSLIRLSHNITEANLYLEICKSSGSIPERQISSPYKESNPVAVTENLLYSRSGIKGHKLVHLDLKGAPPNMGFLLKLLPVLKTFGATGLLVEYEDMFPYRKNLKVIASNNAYKPKEISEFLRKAKDLKLEVVPLLQSFGHLEFALKDDKFSNLREVSKYPDMVCPLKNDSRKLVFQMIDQIIEAHPDIQTIHVGGDEVFHLQMCRACSLSRKSKVELYLHHMVPILKYVEAKTHGKVKPIIWDDMLRRFKEKELKRISKLTDVMVWSYVPDVTRYAGFPENMWKRYTTSLDRIWLAGSFKGALLPNMNVPPVHTHIKNSISWVKQQSILPEHVKVLGIAVTGWSRFDHFATLCELLPASIPSLATCLRILRTGKFDKYTLAEVANELGLDSGIQTHSGYLSNYIIESGSFPGSDVYSLALELENHISWIRNINIRLDSWGSRRQESENKLSLANIEGVEESLKGFIQSLNTFDRKASKTLRQYFQRKIVDEWMEDKVNSLMNHANSLATRTNRLLQGK